MKVWKLPKLEIVPSFQCWNSVLQFVFMILNFKWENILKEKRKKKKVFRKRSCILFPKGNGIKEGAVRLGCVYAVVYWKKQWALWKGLQRSIFSFFFVAFFLLKSSSASRSCCCRSVALTHCELAMAGWGWKVFLPDNYFLWLHISGQKTESRNTAWLCAAGWDAKHKRGAQQRKNQRAVPAPP